MNNTRFATVLHILTLMAYDRNLWHSSAFIASSININPVIVRKELTALQEAGLVISRKGKEGGSRLARSAEEITLADVYRALTHSELLGRKNKQTNPKCPVGNQINERLEELFLEADEVMIQFLGSRTVSDFLKGFGITGQSGTDKVSDVKKE